MKPNKKESINRIIALWALSEAGLGGALHAFRVPFSGLLVSGLSVLFVSLIALLSDGRYRHILKATILVLIIKMVVSPYSPAAAYLAVLFQGVFGWFIFSVAGYHRLSITVLAVVAMVESALQKVITLTIFYGLSLWDSIDKFTQFITRELGFLGKYDGSKYFIGLYLLLYMLGGLFFSAIVISVRRNMYIEQPELMVNFEKYNYEHRDVKRRKRKIGRRTRLAIILLFIVGIIIFIDPTAGWQRAVYVFFRSVFAVLVWYLLVAPLMKKLFESYLRKQKKKFAADVQNTMDFFPTFQEIVWFAWDTERPMKGMKHFRRFLNTIVYLVLNK